MTVYCLTSPSGKCYVGITKTSVKRRWQAHVALAKARAGHPLRNAIRKYGAQSFSIRTICTGLTEPEARDMEIAVIAQMRTTDPKYGYNVSPGGDYDWETGTAAAWAKINATPESRAEYLTKLSSRKLESDWSDYAAIAEAGARWRAENPQRFSEITTKAVAALAKWAEDNPEQMLAQRRAAIRKAHEAIKRDPAAFLKRLSEGIRASFRDPARVERHRKTVTEVWARRDQTERDRVGRAISTAMLAHHASLDADARAGLCSQLAEARTCIDHDVRKARQKEGLAAYWTPERRREVGSVRRDRRMAELGITDPTDYAAYRKEAARAKEARRTLRRRQARLAAE